MNSSPATGLAPGKSGSRRLIDEGTGYGLALERSLIAKLTHDQSSYGRWSKLGRFERTDWVAPSVDVSAK